MVVEEVRVRCQILGVRSVRVHDPDLPIVIERDLRAVGRPSRVARIVVRVVEQAREVAAVGVDRVDAGMAELVSDLAVLTRKDCVGLRSEHERTSRNARQRDSQSRPHLPP